ncbi:MAG TPA: bifunctional riboflavin kinase/FAD synthetase [Chloroflexota bacterium]|nr:bifunctional riboflavin kinase/FAD synthetase [Chloroflexota bacterium]
MIRELFATRLPGPSVVTIGTFDGVHRGHQELLHELRRRADRLGARAVVVTFDPPPRLVLRPDPSYQLLASLEERVELLRRHGADEVLLLRFDHTVAQMSAEAFVGELVDRLGMVELVGGPDLALGHRRQGTPPVLREIGRRRGFAVALLDQVADRGQPVRSGQIRELLRAGDVAAAAELLGHPPSVEGEVVHGDHLGRKLGFPTANLAVPPPRLVPADGVYAARVIEPARPGAMSIGTRPAVGGTDRRVEVHLLDFDGDLYGRTLRVELIAWLHEQRKYASLDDLIAGIGKDVEEVRKRIQG